MECNNTYIYTLSHPITGEVRYVGRTSNLRNRTHGHNHDYGRSSKSKWIQQLRDMGLVPVVEELEVVVREDGKRSEAFYISLFRSWGFDLLNYAGHSESTKKSISESNRKAFSDPIVRSKISTRLKGRKISDETKAKLSKLNTGENNPFYGRPLSDEHRANISKSLMGRKFSAETILKMKNANRKGGSA